MSQQGRATNCNFPHLCAWFPASLCRDKCTTPTLNSTYLPSPDCESLSVLAHTGLHTASSSARARFSFQADDLPLQQRLPLRRSPPCPLSSPSPNCLQQNHKSVVDFTSFSPPRTRLLLRSQCSSLGISISALWDVLPQVSIL